MPGGVIDQPPVAAMAATVVQGWGRFDVLMNNAGIAAHGAIWSGPLEDFERILGANFIATSFCAAAVPRHAIRQRAERIVNVSSMIGKRAYPGKAARCTSKFPRDARPCLTVIGS